MFNVLKKDGIVLTTKYLELFKDNLRKLGLKMKKVIGNVNIFKKSIDGIMSLKKYSSYSEAPKPGKIYYDASIFLSTSMPCIYNLLIEVTESRSMQSSNLNTQIKQQLKLFPSNSSNFNYRNLVHEENFDKEF